jgi:diaminopimelate epimerase
MQVQFHKYHGTGNDFVLIDNRDEILGGTEQDWFAHLCHRHFGIGADGVILLNKHPELDFEMDYFNSDGKRSTMCGNGGRCMARFAADLGLVQGQTRFMAIDGIHEAEILPDRIRLKMILSRDFKQLGENTYYLFTGSPHVVQFIGGNLETHPVVEEGRKIRENWPNGGTNVNFVTQLEDGSCQVRTYERGVEDETLSCGTGVTAVAEVMATKSKINLETVTIHTPGGTLHVKLKPHSEPWLEGPAVSVFTGIIQGPTRV